MRSLKRTPFRSNFTVLVCSYLPKLETESTDRKACVSYFMRTCRHQSHPTHSEINTDDCTAILKTKIAAIPLSPGALTTPLGEAPTPLSVFGLLPLPRRTFSVTTPSTDGEE